MHDAQIFGISVQDAESHRRFVQEHSLNFPLLVDTGRNLSLLFGAADTPSDMSKRITVIVDQAGNISRIDSNVNAKTHGKDLVNFFKGL